MRDTLFSPVCACVYGRIRRYVKRLSLTRVNCRCSAGIVVVLALAGCATDYAPPPPPAPDLAPGQWDAAALARMSYFGCERAVWQLRGESAEQVIALYSRGYVRGDCLIFRPTHGERAVWVHYVFPAVCPYLTISTSERSAVGCAGADVYGANLRPVDEDAPLFYADDVE